LRRLAEWEAMPNVHIPEWDYRDGGLLALARDRREEASAVMDAVLDGFGVAGAAIRPLLPLGDRVAARRLAAMGDPAASSSLGAPSTTAIRHTSPGSPCRSSSDRCCSPERTGGSPLAAGECGSDEAFLGIRPVQAIMPRG